MLVVSENPDGGINLRPLGDFPVRDYTEEDLQAFAAADELDPELAARIDARLHQ